MDFERNRMIGNIAESKIAQWLIDKWGFAVVPLYDVEMESGKGERVFCAKASYVSPDLIALKGEKLYWIEAKHKSVFSWHRISSQWVTGIDLHHWEQYQRLSEVVIGKFVMMFLHREAYGTDRHEPYPCPVGLFGADIPTLQQNENHRHANWGKSGMVYWAHKTLTQYATLEEVEMK